MRKIYSLLLLTAALLCLPMGAKAEELTVADGTYVKQELPVFGYNCDGAQHNQFIFLASELSVMTGADISALKFYLEKQSYTWKNDAPDATFRFAEVEATTVNSLITVDETFIQVYSGQIVFASGEWNIELSTPYHYNGGNLLIDVQTTVGGYVNSNSSTGSRFYSAEADYRGNYNGTVKYYVPKTTFTYELAVSGPGLKVLDGSTKISTGYNYNFGLVTAGTTKTFTLSNPGTEATPVAVAHTGSFGAELSATSIPAGGEVTLTVTMPATTGEDVITISSTAEGIDDFVINVSGTVRDASKMWCNFSEGLPEGWTNSSYTISTTGGGAGTSGGGYAGNTNYSDYRLSTPKVTFAENEKMFLLVSGHGTTASWNSMKVQYSADGTNWTDAKSVTNIANGSWTSVEVTEIPAGTYYIGFYGKYYYLTDIYGGTPVAMPKSVSAAGVTDTEATISWEAAGSETAWQVSYSTNSGDPGNGTIVDATSTSKVLEGLSATTTYYVSVRIGDSGEWSNEISFKTGCAAKSGSWSLNFDELEAGQIPECWDNSGSTSPTYSTYPSYFWAAYKYSYTSDAKMLIMKNSLIQTGTAVINTQRIELPASPAYEFDFDYSHRASCGAFIVKVSEDNGDNWTELGSYTNETGGTADIPAAELIEASIDLSSYAGKTIMLQFYAMANYGSGAIFVDNVAVRVKSNCPLPKNVTVSSVTDHTASVAWTQKGEATAWKLQTSTDGSNWGEEIDATTNPFTLSGLNAETTYYVRVKADCGESEYSDWSDASAAFTTQCEARTLPFATEEFTTIPSCWSVDPEWELYPYEECIKVKSYTASLMMPLIVLSEKAQLSFKHSAGSNNSVKYIVYVNDGESEEKAEEMYSSTSWKQATVDLSAYIGKTVNIIFRSSSSSYNLYLDDVAVNYLPVAVPTNVAATPDNTRAIVTWESEEATYALRYRTNGEGDWTEVADLNTKTYTIENLTNGTAYEVQVKAVASANRQSEWTASTVVTPAACPTLNSIELSEKTFKSVKVSWTASGAGTWVLEYGLNTPYTIVEDLAVTEYVLDNLTPGETYTIKVHPNCSEDALQTTYYPAYTAPTNVVVTNISDVTATASWDAVADATNGYTYSVAPRGNQTPWAYSKIVTDETSVELSGLAGGSDYDFYVVTNYPGDKMSPAIKIEFSTITVAPKSISVSEITASSAKLSWENDGAATVYEYAMGDDPTALEWTEVAEKTKTLEGLTANTAYTFYVRNKYSDQVKSDSINITFRTDCNAIAELPWFEGFEDMAVGNYQSAAPACWAQLNVNNGLPYAYVNSSSTYVKTGSKSMYVVASSLTDGYLILPAFEAALNGLQISFSHKEESATKSAVLTLGYITDIADAGTFVAVKEFGRATSWQEEKEISLASIPNEVATTARLAFKLGKATDQYYTGIDDITVSALPACRKPIIGETTILPDGASFTWTAGNGETKFQYAVGNDPDALEWTATESTEATVHGLVPGNNYKFYVRAFCDPEVSDSVWTAFAPVCNAPTEAALSETTTTTASFSWTAAANITSYQYVVMAKGVAADWSKAETTTNTTAEWTGLAANTAYDFYVRSYYNETVQSAAAKVSFQTECATITELPWNENFESFAENTIPTCWDNTASTASYNASYYLWGVYQYNENKMIRMTNYYVGNTNGSALINTPKITLPASPAQELNFDYAHNATCGDFTIKVSEDEGDTWTTLKTYQKGEGSSYSEPGKFTKETISLSDYAGETIMIQFYTDANYGDGAVFVDNISIHEVPACAVPTGLAASEVTAATATLSWTSEAANFTVQYTTDKENWGDEHEVTAKTLALNDLEEHTTYYARVKAVCGEESESEYCEEISFTTSWAAQSYPYAYSFGETLDARWSVVENHGSNTWTMASEDESYFAQYKTTSNSFNHSVLQTPEVAIPSECDPYLIFNWRNTGAGAEVKISVNGAAAVVLDADFNTELSTVTGTWALKKVSLAAYKGQTVRILFNAISGTANKYAELDEVRFAEKPCLVPTNLTVQAGNGKADVAWTKGEDETAWQLQYKATAAEDWTLVENITSEAYSITGLANGTEYEVQVRAYCDENHQSAWTASVTFTPSEPTGFDNTNAEGKKAVKLIENDQMIIIRDGVKYNAQGQKLQ